MNDFHASEFKPGRKFSVDKKFQSDDRGDDKRDTADQVQRVRCAPARHCAVREDRLARLDGKIFERRHQRAMFGVVHKNHQRPQIIVIDRRKNGYALHHDDPEGHGKAQRKVGTYIARAVDLCRLVNVCRLLRHKGAEQKNGSDLIPRNVRENDGKPAAQEIHLHDIQVLRSQRNNARHEHRQDDKVKQQIPPGKTLAYKDVRRKRGEQRHDDDGHERDENGDAHVRKRLYDCRRIIFPLDFSRQRPQAARRNILLRFQRKDDRDDDGEQRKKQHQDEVKDEYRLRGSAVYAALAYLMPDYGKRISAHVTVPPCSSVSGN